jgi:hypothetical protein
MSRMGAMVTSNVTASARIDVAGGRAASKETTDRKIAVAGAVVLLVVRSIDRRSGRRAPTETGTTRTSGRG